MSNGHLITAYHTSPAREYTPHLGSPIHLDAW